MSTKKFTTKKQFIGTLLHDKINNEVFDIQLKQTHPSLFDIHFRNKTDNAIAAEGRLGVSLTLDYSIIYAHLTLPDKMFIFKESVDILPLPVLIIEADDFYYTMDNLIAINDMTSDF